MISVEQLRKLAALARIKVAPEEEEKLAADMGGILDYVNQIQEISGDAPKSQEKTKNVLREDTNPHESGIHTEAILNEAPKREGDYLKVKKILG
ncbi:MAG: Asp-tRNA(Asn)/Glu-tRNA(Gln) amidotransferase subunit GatC [Patescibacteria group bacterium]